MNGGHYGNVGAYHNIVADVYGAHVKDCEIEVCKKSLAYVCEHAVIKIYGPHKAAVFAHIWDKLPDYLGTLFFLVLKGVIKHFAQLVSLYSQLGKLLVRWVIELSCQHFFLFGHKYFSFTPLRPASLQLQENGKSLR